MAGITLDQAQTQLDLWIAADSAVSRKQAYSINGRSLTLANAREITEKITYWNGQVARLSAAASGRGRVRYGVSE